MSGRRRPQNERVTRWIQPSPFGPLGITVSDAGVRAVDFGHAAPAADDGDPDGEVAAAIEAYCAGEVARLAEVPVDLDGLPPFRRAVLDALHGLPAGELISYGKLGAEVGRPGAGRAVGQAVGTNPVPVIVPCHRVIASDGSIGGFGGGLDIKRRLLAHEGITVGGTGWSSRRGGPAG